MLLPIMHCVILLVLVSHPWPIQIFLPIIIWIYFVGEALVFGGEASSVPRSTHVYKGE